MGNLRLQHSARWEKLCLSPHFLPVPSLRSARGESLGPRQASPRCARSPVPVPGHLDPGNMLELSKAPMDIAFLSFSFYAFGSSVACVHRYSSLQAAVMFSHGASPPQGEAFSTGRVQARPDEDKPIEWGLPGNPQ